MKENEHSERKSAVKFDETKNNIVEFTKNEKINRGLNKIIESDDDDDISLRGPVKIQK